MTVSAFVGQPDTTGADLPITQLDELCEDLFDSLPRADQRRWAQVYLHGLVSIPGRKSIRRISELLTTGEADQCLQQFVNQSPWDWQPVRRALAHRLAAGGGPPVWVADDIAIPKNGSQSVGVARQYVPSAGRVLNCQVGAFISLASRDGGVPVNWRLQLPASWDEDAPRRRRTGVPDDETRRPRWAHVLGMVDEMVRDWGMRPRPLLADLSHTRGLDAVLQSLDARRMRYLLRVPTDTTLGASGRAVRLATLTNPAHSRSGLTVHDGRGNAPLFTSAVLPDQAATTGVVRPRLALTRWRRSRPGEPDAVFVTNLDEQRLPRLADLVQLWNGCVASHRRIHDESGLDHFEGRSYRGWHHHVTLASAAHAHRLTTEPAEQAA